jgi:hypothetical protein
MSYQLNRTDGTLLTELIDGQSDTQSTNLTFVGRNFIGYGEAFNENFIKLLENFSNTAAPSNPLSGQLWWDSSEQRLKVYNGAQWKASGGPIVQATQPQMVAGDLWINNATNQVYAFDGTDLILIGPDYTANQQISGFQIASILDEQSRSRTVAKLFVGGTLVAVLSAITFVPTVTERILGLVTLTNPNGTIFEGINLINKDTFQFYGIADSSRALKSITGASRTADQFLPSDSNGITVGTLTIQNSGGLTIGLSQNTVQKIVGQSFYIENQLNNYDLSLRVRSSAFGSLIVDGIYIDASEARVGIFTTTRLPEYTLDVEGDLRVTGNLIIEGTTTTFETSTLRIEDKNIELGSLNDSSLGDDTAIDGGGITVLSSDGNKTLTWESSTNSWTANKNFNLSSSLLSYKIAGSTKLTTNSLTNILYANDLIQIGTLVNLDVDNININGAAITSSLTLGVIAASGINITAGGDIGITDNRKITGLATPTANQDAANKLYVDSEIANETIAFSFDITGLGVGVTLQNAVAAFINDMYPAAGANTGKFARIHAVSYAGATVSGISVTITQSPNTTGVLTKSLIAVDSNGTQNESVVQDIVSSNTASGVASLTAIRSLMIYQSNGSAWTFVSSTAYP